VDVESSQFQEIANNCAGVAFASCAEGGGASVVTCMQAGLIPVVSYESCIEVGDFGFTLADSAIEAIKEAVQLISALPATELASRARKTWEFARANHTRQAFAENYRQVVRQIMDQKTLSQSVTGP
jgi:hypothetical protein